MMKSVLPLYKGKKVFITGHTGFKGSWMCKLLACAGAEVYGYSLLPETEHSLYEIADIESCVTSFIGDIRDYDHLKSVFDQIRPEIVIHLAAQPIVLEGYRSPRYTYETNVMGTINLMECIRLNDCTHSFVNVTTDKVYLNREWEWGYRENEELNGFDPYSNSKSCSELVTSSYKNSFFADKGIAVSTARAGNVIGGGDFAEHRIIPDCVRAAISHEDIILRNPHSVRPYQHVLEPVYAYLMIAARQYDDIHYAGSYNVGPDEKDCVRTEELAEYFVNKWGGGLSWRSECTEHLHESNILKLDCSRIKSTFGWKPNWSVEKAVEKVVEWSKCWLDGNNVSECMEKQIHEYIDTI